jgi:hypothetical protein
MALVLKPLDQVLRVEADSAIGASMHLEILLPVALDSSLGDDSLQHWTFRHTSV